MMDNLNRIAALDAILSDDEAMLTMTRAVRDELADLSARKMWIGNYNNGLAVREPGDELTGCLVRFGTPEAMRIALNALAEASPGWTEVAEDVTGSVILMEIMRKSVEDELVRLRDLDFQVDVPAGFTIRDRSGEASGLFRLGVEDGITFALGALAGTPPRLVQAMLDSYEVIMAEQAGQGDPG